MSRMKPNVRSSKGKIPHGGPLQYIVKGLHTLTPPAHGGTRNKMKHTGHYHGSNKA